MSQEYLDEWVAREFDDMSIHPTGTVVATRGARTVVVIPRRRVDDELYAWSVTKYEAGSDDEEDIDIIPVNRVDLLTRTIRDWTDNDVYRNNARS